MVWSKPLVVYSNLPQFCANLPLALAVCMALSGMVKKKRKKRKKRFANLGSKMKKKIGREMKK